MSDRGGVLLLHGHGRFGASMARLAAAARRSGRPTLAPSYPYRRSLAEIVTWLAPRVAAFERTFTGPLHIVTHSLGGLVSRALIAAHQSSGLGRSSCWHRRMAAASLRTSCSVCVSLAFCWGQRPSPAHGAAGGRRGAAWQRRLPAGRDRRRSPTAAAAVHRVAAAARRQCQHRRYKASRPDGSSRPAGHARPHGL